MRDLHWTLEIRVSIPVVSSTWTCLSDDRIKCRKKRILSRMWCISEEMIDGWVKIDIVRDEKSKDSFFFSNIISLLSLSKYILFNNISNPWKNAYLLICILTMKYMNRLIEYLYFIFHSNSLVAMWETGRIFCVINSHYTFHRWIKFWKKIVMQTLMIRQGHIDDIGSVLMTGKTWLKLNYWILSERSIVMVGRLW